MSSGGTSPSTFLFLLGRAHAIPEVVEGIIVPAANRGAGGASVCALVSKLGPVAQLVRARA